MPSVEELLSAPDIKSYLETHQGEPAERIERAARKLQKEHDAPIALRKLLPALTDGSISVFFSYKTKDEEVAAQVVDELRKHAGGRLKITYQAEFTEAIVGKKWRDAIRAAIRPANWFLLLLPDPSEDWDWCLFETGLFVADRSSADLLICLHHPDIKIPSEIEDYHAVSATIPEVEKFLRFVFVNEDTLPGMPPINPDIEDSISEIATRIVEAVRPPRSNLLRETFEPWVSLRIEEADRLESKEDLDAATVLDANQAALALFGFLRPPPTWGQLRSDIVEAGGDGRWRNELFHVLRRIAQGRKFNPVQAVFKTEQGKIYRPVACAIDRIGTHGAIDTFHVTFTEEVGALDATEMPAEASMLANLLRFTFRFRWEVLERFSQPPLSESDLLRLENALRRLKRDWESRQVGSDDEIFNMFSERDRLHFQTMAARWHEIMNEEGTGELDLALAEKNAEKIPELLAAFLPMNQDFLEIAAERFSELVSGKAELAHQ